jgi:hypothetical protein
VRPKTFAALLLSLLLAGLCARPGRAAPAPRAADQAEANEAAAPRRGARQKRVTVGGHSDTARGTRQTIRSDGSLSDYSAYRSGDRFYVVLPKADAGRVARGAGGRAYTDMEVQQRGEDVVLSYRLRPGARPRVEQRFNRLDVVFDVPEEGAASGAPQGETPPAAARGEGRQEPPRPGAANARAVQPETPSAGQTPAKQQRPAPASNDAASSEGAPAGQTEAGPHTDQSRANQPPSAQPDAEAGQQPDTSDDPAAAQADATAQPTPANTPSVINTSPAESQTAASAGAIILKNWPVALAALLALIGLGLVIAARRRRASSSRAAVGEVESVAGPAEELKEDSGAAGLGPAEASAVAVPSVEESAPQPEDRRPEAAPTLSPEPSPLAASPAQEVSAIESEATAAETPNAAPADAAASPTNVQSAADAEPRPEAAPELTPGGARPGVPDDGSASRVAAFAELSGLPKGEAFRRICETFDDEAAETRAAAARALYEHDADRVGSLTRALREADAERRRRIGEAINSSGLAAESLAQLTADSQEKTYEAFSVLFLMAKAGEVGPLLSAVESHPSGEVRLAVVKLLALSGQREVLPAFRRLSVRGSLPADVRAAVKEAIYQIGS